MGDVISAWRKEIDFNRNGKLLVENVTEPAAFLSSRLKSDRRFL